MREERREDVSWRLGHEGGGEDVCLRGHQRGVVEVHTRGHGKAESRPPTAQMAFV